MKQLVVILGLSLASSFTFGSSFECSDEPQGYCAAAAFETNNKSYLSECQRVSNLAQDLCAAAAIRTENKSYISDCLTFVKGGRCAAAAFKKESKSYLSECKRVKTDAQDRCAAAAIETDNKSYLSTCLSF